MDDDTIYNFLSAHSWQAGSESIAHPPLTRDNKGCFFAARLVSGEPVT